MMVAETSKDLAHSSNVLASTSLVGRYADRDKVANAIVRSVKETLHVAKFMVFDTRQHCASMSDVQALCLAIGERLGELQSQDANSNKVIEVFDRKLGSMRQGVRYHQSREGGDIHTDSVNHPVAMKYLILGCASSAKIGGETIILRADDVYSRLVSERKVCQNLMGRFWFEGRGMGENVQLFQMPILTLENGSPRFRYLRTYIESAYEKAGEQLSEEQVHSLNYLDCTLSLSQLQNRFLLQSGHILIAYDTEVFHGRSAFIDKIDAVSNYEWGDQRRMYRIWVQ